MCMLRLIDRFTRKTMPIIIQDISVVVWESKSLLRVYLECSRMHVSIHLGFRVATVEIRLGFRLATVEIRKKWNYG